MDVSDIAFNSSQLREIADLMDKLEDHGRNIRENGDPTSVFLSNPVDVTLHDDSTMEKGQIEFVDEMVLFYPAKE